LTKKIYTPKPSLTYINQLIKLYDKTFVEKVINKVFKDKFSNKVAKSAIFTLVLFATINSFTEFVSRSTISLLLTICIFYATFQIIAFGEKNDKKRKI